MRTSGVLKQNVTAERVGRRLVLLHRLRRANWHYVFVQKTKPLRAWPRCLAVPYRGVSMLRRKIQSPGTRLKILQIDHEIGMGREEAGQARDEPSRSKGWHNREVEYGSGAPMRHQLQRCRLKIGKNGADFRCIGSAGQSGGQAPMHTPKKLKL